MPRAWSSSETLGLADQHCTQCFGLGLRPSVLNRPLVCPCVLRHIFDVCHRRFRRAAADLAQQQGGSLHRRERFRGAENSAACGQPERRRYGYPNAEYCADFLAIAKRTLSPVEHQVFTWHFLYGADFRAINRKLGRDPGDRSMFHFFYRVEEKLGRAFRDTAPYGLFPVDEYFGGTVRRARLAAAAPAAVPSATPRLQVPLAREAT